MHLSGFTVINKKIEIRSRKMKPAYVINKHANNFTAIHLQCCTINHIYTHAFILFYSIAIKKKVKLGKCGIKLL